MTCLFDRFLTCLLDLVSKMFSYQFHFVITFITVDDEKGNFKVGKGNF